MFFAPVLIAESEEAKWHSSAETKNPECLLLSGSYHTEYSAGLDHDRFETQRSKNLY